MHSNIFDAIRSECHHLINNGFSMKDDEFLNIAVFLIKCDASRIEKAVMSFMLSSEFYDTFVSCFDQEVISRVVHEYRGSLVSGKSYLICSSPFRKDRNPSFTVNVCGSKDGVLIPFCGKDLASGRVYAPLEVLQAILGVDITVLVHLAVYRGGASFRVYFISCVKKIFAEIIVCS